MVNIYEPKFTLLQQGILRFLFNGVGKQFNARALARNLNVSPPAISKALPLLEKEEFVTVSKDKESKRMSIELNRDNQKVIQFKRVENLKLVYESGLNNELEEKFAGGTIILFGSFSMGEDLFNSDIDLAIIGRKEKKVDLSEYEKLFGKEIRINFYDTLSGVHKHLRENICRGIVLSGSIEF